MRTRLGAVGLVTDPNYSMVRWHPCPLGSPLRSPHAPSVLGAMCAQWVGRGSSAAGVLTLCSGRALVEH